MIMTACYLQNRMASKHCNGRTPYEVMFNMTPNVSHLRVFGSVCYPLIQKKQRDPYRHKATCDVGIFVGYDRQSCGYLVYIPSKKRVFVRYDCWFDENWRVAHCIDGKKRPTYDNPGLTDSPMPSGPLISGGPILVPAVSVGGVPCQPVPCDMTTAPDCAPTRLPTPLAHPIEWLPSPANEADVDGATRIVPAAKPMGAMMPLSVLPVAANGDTVWHIDLFAGTSLSLRYHLQNDSTCHVIAVDRITFEEAVSYIPVEYRSRFHYVQWDLGFLTYDGLCNLLTEFGCTPSKVSTCHASPPCETVSVAHHNKSPHRVGEWRSSQAVADDAMLDAVCACMQQLSARHPHMLLSMENPMSTWADMQPVRRLASADGWQLVNEIDHCMVTCELDTEWFPMKPTTWVLFGCRPQSDLCCFNRCTNRLTTKGARHLHRVLICNRADKHPAQVVLEDDKLLKSKIPLGMFRFLERIRIAPDQPSEVPIGNTDGKSMAAPTPSHIDPTPAINTNSYGNKIVATGKQAREQSINARVRLISGLSHDEAIGLMVPRANGTASKYLSRDLRWDLKHGYIEYAALASEPTPQQCYEARVETAWHNYLAMLTASGREPQTRKMAEKTKEWPEWLAAELDEVNSLVRMGVFKWVPNSTVPNGAKRLNCKMVYKDKCATPGVPARKKVRCVGRGFMETADEYGDCFAPVCRPETCRAFFASAAKRNDSLCSIDVKSAFCTAPINRTVYMNAPEGHERPGFTILLGRAIYGLCDSPRAYFQSFSKALGGLEVRPTGSDPCMFKSHNPRYRNLWIICYVDDLILRGPSSEISAFKADFTKIYEIRDYGEPESFLGMEVTRDRVKRTIKLTQTQYIEQMAKRFGMLDSNYVATPLSPSAKLTSIDDSTHPPPDPKLFRAIIGSLMYANMTRCDIAHAVSQLSRYLAKPTQAHMNEAKHVVAYLYHHRHLGPTYDGNMSAELVGYTDADWAGCLDTRRSTSARIFMFMGAALTWASKQQRTVATSSAEAEYTAASDCAREAMGYAS